MFSSTTELTSVRCLPQIAVCAPTAGFQWSQSEAGCTWAAATTAVWTGATAPLFLLGLWLIDHTNTKQTHRHTNTHILGPTSDENWFVHFGVFAGPFSPQRFFTAVSAVYFSSSVSQPWNKRTPDHRRRSILTLLKLPIDIPRAEWLPSSAESCVFAAAWRVLFFLLRVFCSFMFSPCEPERRQAPLSLPVFTPSRPPSRLVRCVPVKVTSQCKVRPRCDFLNFKRLFLHLKS